MTPEQIKAYNRAKTQRRRAAERLGMEHVGLWCYPSEHLPKIQDIIDETEALIVAEVKRRHGDDTYASLDDLRAMRDRGEIKAHENARPGEDLPDEFWSDAE